KEECIIALFDRAASVVAAGMASAATGAGRADAAERMKAGTRAFLTSLAENPEFAQTLLVEIIGAGPRAAQRRDQIMQAFADTLDAENAAAAPRGAVARVPPARYAPAT